ncbi:hypothetical protein A6F68_02139 [Tsuneonella dongtanensis]|uniref:Uncharacterized protein n=1 Tax=Tsuneonella dongtanensis TaxID=692370 RepID=A0A1B2AEV1_9SPHN|nr:hypothetical protein [Tsuneonella dongtanensis]ANY20641.1 hypothetical protein A6F68_02139 [Tsuneonella dongtanensis]
MSDALEQQLREDRALRDAARVLFDADLAHLRASLAGKSISSRIVDRIGEGASEALDEAMEVADNNKGIIATLIAAIVLWFARHPIIDLLTEDDEGPAPPEQNEEAAR